MAVRLEGGDAREARKGFAQLRRACVPRVERLHGAFVDLVPHAATHQPQRPLDISIEEAPQLGEDERGLQHSRTQNLRLSFVRRLACHEYWIRPGQDGRNARGGEGGRLRPVLYPSRTSTTRAHSSHYDLLGVSPNSNEDAIKAAFRRAAKAYHPDICKEPGSEARFVKINTAYGILLDGTARAAYDVELLRSRGVGTAGASRSPWGSGSGGAVEYTWVVDDDSDSEDEEELLEFLAWASTGNNYKASFQSSWQANAKRKQRQESERRAAAERAAREASRADTVARSARGSSDGSGRSGRYGSWAEPAAARASASPSARPGGARGASSASGGGGGGGFRSGSVSGGGGVGGFSREDLMASLWPEARTAARAVFGGRLERLGSVEQLSDFIDTLDALQSGGSALIDLDYDSDSHDDDDVDGLLDLLLGRARAPAGGAGRARGGGS
ncbi:hypothetical protein FOA52_004537 [Chlamydomonas sp. UWO 241]|nr:hypothetical protein FOA52_004537 [Chlamydomonas sp. UWO 241]